MPRNRQLLLAVLAAALVVATTTYALVGRGGGSEPSVTAAGDASTTTAATAATASTASTLDRSSTTSDPSPSTTTQTAGTTGTTGSAASSTSASTARPGSTSTTLRPASTTTAPAPAFASSVHPVTTEELGASWRPGCPVGADQLRALDVSHWGYDGAVHTGRLIVAAQDASAIVAVFRDMYVARFPVHQIVPIDRYGGDDQASMRADNTSGFNCRTVAGSSSWSEHAYGRAIDVNPLVNPYVRGSSVDPPEGAPYADRSRNDPGMIHADDAAVRAFAAQGWRWGGYWSNGKDYQHFSASGR